MIGTLPSFRYIGSGDNDDYGEHNEDAAAYICYLL